VSRPFLSVVVPTLDEERAIVATLERLREPGVLEVIVADGGSGDRTRELAAPLADRVLVVARGRASQMNAAVRIARGSVLFFVHADTLAPPGFATAIAGVLEDPRIAGGRFDVAIDDPRLAFRVISTMINARSRITGLFTGDQGIFVRRDVFDRIGGFPEEPLMEDLALALALRREGRTAALRERVVTSARRWTKRGVARTVVRMWTLRSLFALGVSPRTLARWYEPVR
jgi:rSAM/selenodomain-associated transferase 2